MSSKTKIKVIILGVVAAILLVLYIVVSSAYVEPQVEPSVELPTGKMSDSVFEFQNMSRTDYDVYPVEYAFENFPILLKVPDTASAVNNGATFNRLSDDYLFYYDIAENDANIDITEMLRGQVTEIIKSGADPKATVMTLLASEEGYLNGCSGSSYTYEIIVQDVEVPFYASVFVLSPFEGLKLGNGKIVVGCMGSGSAYSYMDGRYRSAMACCYTMKIDMSRAKKLWEREE